LIIDDDKDVRQSMEDVLEIQGYHPVCAADGAEAIERLNRLDSAPCVILLDMMMPGMNGWQFLDYQRGNEKYAHIPVIVCTALAATAKSIKPSAIVAKPVDRDTLLRAVRTFCA
jgi:CheY-like chemotaxis protein